MTIAVDASGITAALIQQDSARAWALDVVEHDELRMDLFDHRPFADRIWALRRSLTPYDAWYVARA